MQWGGLQERNLGQDGRLPRRRLQPHRGLQADDFALGGAGHNMGLGGAGAGDLAPVEEMSFEELVGLRGPFLSLLENAVTVLACNVVLLSLTVLLPFTLGRVTCQVRHPPPPVPLPLLIQ